MYLVLPPILSLLRCCSCKRHLPAACFHKASSTKERRQYSYNCKSCKNEYARRRPTHLKKRKAEQSKAWRLNNKHRQAFNNQKANAKKRGIPFRFDYDQWLEWWGSDIERRGCHSGQLVMARQGDTGEYSPANVYKATCNANSSLASKRRGASISCRGAG